jgi:hypothetical protein
MEQPDLKDLPEEEIRKEASKKIDEGLEKLAQDLRSHLQSGGQPYKLIAKLGTSCTKIWVVESDTALYHLRGSARRFRKGYYRFEVDGFKRHRAAKAS